MTLAKFREEPWKTSHGLYQRSALAMAPAPEYASSEVILSSLYRVIGLPGLREGAVPQRGKLLDRHVQKLRDRQTRPDGAALDADSFHMMLHSVLESPKLPNQSSKRFLQVTPLVPQLAIFSGSARLAGTPWSAGTLVRRMIWLGAPDSEAAQQVWNSLFAALSVADDDDIFARFLQLEVATWTNDPEWKQVPPEDTPVLDQADRNLTIPARQFVKDLSAVIEAKGSMTRRQWTSLLEAIFRIAAVSHIVWLCDLHDRAWDCIRKALLGSGPATEEEARVALFPRSFAYLSYGDRALSTIKDRASSFLQARLGINAMLWAMEELTVEVKGGISSASELLRLCEEIRSERDRLIDRGVLAIIDEVRERENRAVLCHKGIGRNIMEFARHVLGQRQAASAILRGYDQSYVLRKKGTSKSSPWVVGLGPVAVLAQVHCSLAGTTGPRSVRRLAQHLGTYGITVDYRDIAQNDLGHQLRMLGLVLDSPDAESGMLLVPPFVGHDA